MLFNILIHTPTPLTKIYLNLQGTSNAASYNPPDVSNDESTDCYPLALAPSRPYPPPARPGWCDCATRLSYSACATAEARAKLTSGP